MWTVKVLKYYKSRGVTMELVAARKRTERGDGMAPSDKTARLSPRKARSSSAGM